VPEIAERAHVDHLHTLIQAALTDAKIAFRVSTASPRLRTGLIGGLMSDGGGQGDRRELYIPFWRSITSKVCADAASHR